VVSASPFQSAVSPPPPRPSPELSARARDILLDQYQQHYDNSTARDGQRGAHGGGPSGSEDGGEGEGRRWIELYISDTDSSFFHTLSVPADSDLEAFTAGINQDLHRLRLTLTNPTIAPPELLELWTLEADRVEPEHDEKASCR
jgi:hypothetical protein